MRLSIVDLAQVPPGGNARSAFANSIALAQRAEELGYHRFWVAEHHGIGGSIASSCPPVLIGQIAAATRSIRVGSGSVLLDYTNPMPVAEQFQVLHAMFPDRIDLGIGRASSGSPTVDHALRGRSSTAVDAGTEGSDSDPVAGLMALMEHEARVTEVVRWIDRDFPDDHPYARVELLPGVDSGPQVWLLGASLASAALAGRLGLPYCYAAFINPLQARAAFAIYRGAFRPAMSANRLESPYAMLGVHLCCAETDEEAARLRASADLFHLDLAARAAGPDAGRPAPLLDPDSAVRALDGCDVPAHLASRQLSGGPERVRALLDELGAATSADEIIIQDLVADHAARVRSYELIAEACASGA